ncbi:unnamed protein product [Closterium sp. Yama58-4]|nr:unnamed protein product [Closterium sp. Yama58-4]
MQISRLLVVSLAVLELGLCCISNGESLPQDGASSLGMRELLQDDGATKTLREGKFLAETLADAAGEATQATVAGTKGNNGWGGGAESGSGGWKDALWSPAKLLDAFVTSLSMILVSEIGDETFIIAALMAMRHPRSIVLAGALSALGIMTVLSTGLGLIVPNLISRKATNSAATVLYTFFGLRLLYIAWKADPKESAAKEMEEVEEKLESEENDKGRHRGIRKFFAGFCTPVFLEAFILTFLAEWGDRSQIATIALAAHKNALGVTVGATLGHVVCTSIAVHASLAASASSEHDSVDQTDPGLLWDFSFDSDEDDGPLPETPSRCLLHAFSWSSHEAGGGGINGRWYDVLAERVGDFKAMGFSDLIFPPCCKAADGPGFAPVDFYDLNSAYGTEASLRKLLAQLHAAGLGACLHVVVNRMGGLVDTSGSEQQQQQQQQMGGGGGVPGGVGPGEPGLSEWNRLTNTVDEPAVWRQGEQVGIEVQAEGGRSSVMDHGNPAVEEDCKGWLRWLRFDVGFDAWCFDLARAFDPAVAHSYCWDTSPTFAVADVWTEMRYQGGTLEYDQDGHRALLADWVKAAKGTPHMIDYTTKGILQAAVQNCEYWRLIDPHRPPLTTMQNLLTTPHPLVSLFPQGILQAAVQNCEYWRLIDPQGRPPGLIGLLPAKAVTFVDNHSTGSTQQHWPFPAWGVTLGYVYILTHPGVPCVFIDHLYEWNLKDQIQKLLAIRQRNGITSRSAIRIMACSTQLYVARTGTDVDDDRLFRGVVVKLGPSFDMHGTAPDPSWQIAMSGHDFCIWEKNTEAQ